uniref:Major facilitator superfamily (MFS) profile domain-containing protein n=1 Tax=mine drainage metagenome TaxID=410659 RepID=E6PTS7_9ZZZZ
MWGRLVAQQPGQIAYSIIDAKAVGRFMPPLFPGAKAASLPELARQLALDESRFMQTLDAYNAACRPGHFDPTRLDDCHTEGLTPAKTHWARSINTPPFFGYALRPGVTFTYLGLKTDETAAVRFGGERSPNLFVAGEMMAGGNVLGKGYTAGVGMSIGTAFGRIADRVGRKDAMVYALVLMGASTLLIGLTPSYDSIGVVAPVLLIVFRLMQGISFGAEFGTASTWVVEQAAHSKRRAF